MGMSITEFTTFCVFPSLVRGTPNRAFRSLRDLWPYTVPDFGIQLFSKHWRLQPCKLILVCPFSLPLPWSLETRAAPFQELLN